MYVKDLKCIIIPTETKISNRFSPRLSISLSACPIYNELFIKSEEQILFRSSL